MADGYRQPTARALGWVETALGTALGAGCRVASVSRLVGGLTADMDRLAIVSDSGRFDVVLRRWTDPKWAAGLVDREAVSLTALAGRSVPAPRLLATDRSGEEAGTPCLLMSALPGESLLQEPELAACLPQLVKTLVRIHDLPSDGLEETDPHGADEHVDLGWIDDPSLARAVREALLDQPRLPRVLAHGDYQPFNVLWQDGQLSGVVDWTFAGRGTREIDVGHCRLALAVLFSPELAERFLRCYEAETGVRVDARADVRALLAFDLTWLEFIPRQLAGRAPLRPGMPERVKSVLRAAVARLG